MLTKPITPFLCLLLIWMSGSAIPDSFLTKHSSLEQVRETQTEIHVRKLPKAVRLDITKNYNGAEVTKAYKTFVDGVHNGYVVEAKKGKQKWEIKYDTDGKPLKRQF